MKQLMIICILIVAAVNCIKAQNFEQKFHEYGLIDVAELDSTIRVKLLYSTSDNFTSEDMYGTLEKAYLQPEFARMVVRAQELLKEQHPQWSLVIFDAARPMSVQQRMFKLVAGTPLNIYVANPSKGGGRHNYGAAIDISIIDSNGELLDMGSTFDHFGNESHTDGSEKGLISDEAVKNRLLLFGIMERSGLKAHPKEWWHFQKYTIAELNSRYKRLDF